VQGPLTTYPSKLSPEFFLFSPRGVDVHACTPLTAVAHVGSTFSVGFLLVFCGIHGVARIFYGCTFLPES